MYHYKYTLKPNAQKLRQTMTPEEMHLWLDFLKNLPITVKRQACIANYIVDFYCASAHLVIELDGSQHFEDRGREYDERRTTALQARGLTVIRIPNNELMRNFRGVCEYIDMTVRQRM